MQGRKEWDIDPQTQERALRPLREVALEAFYFRRLHHFQATRELVILKESDEFHAPDYIAFTWASLRDIRRTSREALLQELKKPDPDGVELPGTGQDIKSLEALPTGEALAIVRPPHVTPRANVSAPSKLGAAPWRSSKIAVLPLILEGTALPARLRKLPAAPLPAHYRLSRSDVEIEAQPLLVTMPAHRYLPAFREQKRQELSRMKQRTSTKSSGT
jgi:DNA replication terminus site-binding protein (Ter protein)